ncbi:MAG: DUF433 domain-containing protein [Terriglobia bacterium]
MFRPAIVEAVLGGNVPAGIMYNSCTATLDTTQIAPLASWEDGSIRIGSSRVTLDTIVHEFRSGATAEQIQDDFPTFSLREIYGAISYYLEHEEQVEAYLRRRDQEADRIRREIEDRPRADALRRRIRERYARLKAKPGQPTPHPAHDGW